MCKFISKAFKKVEKLQNKILKPVGINSNFFGGKLKSIVPVADGGLSDIDQLSEKTNAELAEEKRKATEDQIQATTAKRFRSGARGRRSLFRSTSGGGAGFYNRFNL